MSLRASLAVGLVLLQSADVLLTWRLLSTREDAVEANPVAGAILESHGWVGVITLKAVCTTIILACALAIIQARPLFGHGLLAGMCALMLGVVGYSAVLVARGGEEEVTHANKAVRANLDGRGDARFIASRR
jgi:hypothetical protein